MFSGRLWAAVGHRRSSAARSLAIAGADRVDSLGQGVPRAATVTRDRFVSISVSVEEVSSARVGTRAPGCGEHRKAEMFFLLGVTSPGTSKRGWSGTARGFSASAFPGLVSSGDPSPSFQSWPSQVPRTAALATAQVPGGSREGIFLSGFAE